MASEHCTIVGGGLVGALQAIFMAKRGYRVDVYERRPDLRKTRVSAGRSINLALAERGIYSLRQAGVFSLVEPDLIPMKGRMIHDEAGSQSLQPYGQREGEVIYSVSRGGLNRLLLDASEATGSVRFYFQNNCLSVDPENDLLEIKDEFSGSTKKVSYEKLIVSDGSSSRLRRQMEESGLTNSEVSVLGHSYKELLLPRSSEKGGFALAPEALHIWPRKDFMMIGLPNPDHSFTMTLFLATKGSPGFPDLENPEALSGFFERWFPDLSTLLPDYPEQFYRNPTGSLATVRCFPWKHKNIIMLGDAAHAIVPFHGQGMNCGFEDCTVLEECLNRYSGWEEAISQYERVRKPDCDAIAELALENYVEMRSAVRDPDYLIKKEVAFHLEQSFPEVFVPRYSMVMFHRTPYREAQQRGEIQKEILSACCAGLTRAEDLDTGFAGDLIREKLPPFSDPEKQNFAGHPVS